MTTSSSNRGSSGGAAASAGSEFQARVAAYYAVSMLCEDTIPTPFELPSGTQIQAVRCEVSAAVDDIQLATSGGGVVAIQAKHRVTASTSTTSPIASALAQFVNAWIDARADSDGRGRLREDRDRLVLACGPDSVASVRRALPLLLQRFATIRRQLQTS